MAAETGMAGRVCVVTGATAGMGQAMAAELARRGATVVLVARSREKAMRTRDAQVRAAAAQVIHRYPAVHVLINNAAVYTRRREETADGIGPDPSVAPCRQKRPGAISGAGPC